jgi:hypothetical protein
MSGNNKASTPTLLTAMKQIAILAIAVVLFAATLVTSYHYHSDFKTRSACVVCKSAEQLAAGDTEDLFVPAPLDSALIAYIAAPTEISTAVIVLPGQTRAPPRSASSLHC